MDETPIDGYPPVSVACTVTAHASAAEDYDRNAAAGFHDVPPGPIAEFVASLAEGGGERGTRAMRAIAEDDQYGPIHLVRLVAAAEVAARKYGGGLLAGETGAARAAQLIAGDVSPEGFPDLVAALRSEGLHAATEVARAMTPAQRLGVLDPLLHYVYRFFTAALLGPEASFARKRR